MLKDSVFLMKKDDCFLDLIKAMKCDLHTYDDETGTLYEEIIFDDYNWEAGVSKVCVFFSDFVLKKGFNGSIIDSNYDTGELLEPEDFIYNTWDINYGDLEYTIYKKAEREGVNNFFAELISLGDGIYAQEKCQYILGNIIGTTVDDLDFYIDYSTASENIKSINKIKEILNNSEIDEIIGIDPTLYLFPSVAPVLLQFYTCEQLIKLFVFLVKYDINDLHLMNLGFFRNKESEKFELKLFDYSGFESETSELVGYKKIS